MHATNIFIYRFQGCTVVSQLAVHAESEMKIFMSGPLQVFTFSGKFCIPAVGKEAEMIDIHQNF